MTAFGRMWRASPLGRGRLAGSRTPGSRQGGPRPGRARLDGSRLDGSRLGGSRLGGAGLGRPRLGRLRSGGRRPPRPELGGPPLAGPRLGGPRLTGLMLGGSGLADPGLAGPRLGGRRLVGGGLPGGSGRSGPAGAGAAAEARLRRGLDLPLLGAALALSLLGALLVWSATRPKLLAAGGNPQAYLDRQLLNLAIGLVLGAVVAAVDYRTLRTLAPVGYVGSCLGLVAVLAIGTTINGAHSWIVIGGGFEVEPSEFAKLALVAGLAVLFAERRTRENTRPAVDIALALGTTMLPLGLVMLQPDLGTAIVFGVTVLGVLVVAGVRARAIVTLVLLGVLGAGAALQFGVLKQYQLDRFTAFIDPHANTQGSAYNVTQARIAIGAGGLTGSGLFKGRQTNGQFVPEQQTDFVFTVAGEELGFVGAAGIIVLLAIMLWRALRISGRSPDLFGRLVAAGVAVWFAFQSFVNIGMTLGITPITGLPLPFVSYGGSAMFANWMAVGLLLNVYRRTRLAEPG